MKTRQGRFPWYRAISSTSGDTTAEENVHALAYPKQHFARLSAQYSRRWRDPRNSEKKENSANKIFPLCLPLQRIHNNIFSGFADTHSPVLFTPHVLCLYNTLCVEFVLQVRKRHSFWLLSYLNFSLAMGTYFSKTMRKQLGVFVCLFSIPLNSLFFLFFKKILWLSTALSSFT